MSNDDARERGGGGGSAPPSAVHGQADEGAVWSVLRTCYDPEIPVNIVDLGLIYGCRVTPHERGGQQVEVTMTLTAPGCLMSEVLAEDIRRKVSDLAGVEEVRVQVVFDPPWDESMMTDAARLELGLV